MRLLRATLAVAAASTVMVAGLSVAGSDPSGDVPRAELARVRSATARFHDLEAAVDAGYELLPVCFEDEANDAGMGWHYWVGEDDLDAEVDARSPEALVYEPTDHGLKLVAVEYIVPVGLLNEPPMVLGQMMHQPEGLPFYVLHAWIWQPNPDDVFADYNPDVNLC